MILTKDGNDQIHKPSALIPDAVVNIPVLIVLVRLGVQRRGVVYNTEWEDG